MKLKPWRKNVLSVLVIVVVGYGLFLTAFLLAAVVMKVCNAIVVLFAGKSESDQNIRIYWHYVYVILILLLSWFVLKSKLNDLFKATYLTMPLIVVLAEVGIHLYQQPPWVTAGISTVIVGAMLFYLYKKKLSWLYYFSTFYVVAMALYVLFSGMEI